MASGVGGESEDQVGPSPARIFSVYRYAFYAGPILVRHVVSDLGLDRFEARIVVLAGISGAIRLRRWRGFATDHASRMGEGRLGGMAIPAGIASANRVVKVALPAQPSPCVFVPLSC
jgi:hypothetical protein